MKTDHCLQRPERGAGRSEQREEALSRLGLSLSVFYPCLCWEPQDYWCVCCWLQTGPWCTVLGVGQRDTASGGGGGDCSADEGEAGARCDPAGTAARPAGRGAVAGEAERRGGAGREG